MHICKLFAPFPPLPCRANVSVSVRRGMASGAPVPKEGRREGRKGIKDGRKGIEEGRKGGRKE